MMYAAVLKGDFNRENGVDFPRIGILAYESEHIADCVEDVVSDYGEAGELVQMLNQNEVSVLHFRDVLEDYLVQREN